MRRLLPIACNHVAVLLLGIVGVVFTSKWVPPAVYGAYALFLTLTQLGCLLTHSGLYNHAARNWQRERGQADLYARFLWRTSWNYAGYLALLLAPITLLLLGRFREPFWAWVFPLLLFSNMAVALATIANGALNAQESNWLVFWLGLIGSLRALVPLAMVWLTSASLWALTVGFSLHGALLLGLIMCLFRRAWNAPTARPDLQTRWARELRDYGRPFVLMGVGGWLLQNADRWVVAQFFGEAQAGLFAMASNIGAIVPSLFAAGLMQLFFPRVFRQADAAKTVSDWHALARFCDRITWLLLGLSLVGLAALSWIGPHLVGWLIGEKYQVAMTLLFPAGLAMLTVQANQFQYLLLQSRHNSVDMVKAMIVVAVVKTAGSVVAAAINWSAFLLWLALSTLVCAWLGRFLIQRLALRSMALAQS